MSASDVLVLGDSGVGKTHFAGQLLARMRHDQQGILRMRPGGVEDLSKLEEIIGCLEEGRAAGHTSAETWTGIKCELETGAGADIIIEWPEYAGERLFSIVERRLVPKEWHQSIQRARGWLLFIRPSNLKIYEDLLVRPTGIAPTHSDCKESNIQESVWDDQARYVELLQMFLFASKISSFKLIESPRLAIVLSCWDELDLGQCTPESQLSERLPLLDTFVRSNWKDAALVGMGAFIIGSISGQARSG